MKKIFITYGDFNFEESKKRLIKQARALKVFDRHIAYGPKDLPSYILNSPIMSFGRGSGYWIWKPWIIWKTLQENPNSIVVYADAGCTVQASNAWNEWFSIMENTDAIVMQYREDFDYGWANYYDRMDVRTGSWTKKEMAAFFDDNIGKTDWRGFAQLVSGIIIAKNNSIVVKTWMEWSLLYPQLLVDPVICKGESTEFIQHRHDQSLLTGIVYALKDNPEDVMVIKETAESDSCSPIVASRITDYRINPKKFSPKVTIKTRTINVIKTILGETLYETIHGFIFSKR